MSVCFNGAECRRARARARVRRVIKASDASGATVGADVQ